MRVGLYNFDKNELEEVKEIVNNELCNMGIINEIDNVVYSGNKHCSIIQKYFSNVASDGSYIIAEATNNKIKVDDINELKYNEQIAILASFTADTSYNMFAAEVKAHSDYLVNWISKFKD